MLDPIGGCNLTFISRNVVSRNLDLNLKTVSKRIESWKVSRVLISPPALPFSVNVLCAAPDVTEQSARFPRK